MKKVCVLLISVLLLLNGCAEAPVFEQVDDVYNPSEASEPKIIRMILPNDASTPVLSGDSGTLYFCDGYEIMVQTMASGDLDGTLKTLTGYEREALSILKTRAGEIKRYECAWTSAGEGGDRVGRVVVLDDGSYHYSVAVMADALDAGALQESWQELFSGIVLS